MFDVAILGAGPAGYVAAIKAAQLGLEVVLFEEDKLGGVCLNKGCIPTKSLLKSAQIAHYIKNAKTYGINVEGYHADFAAVMRRKDSIVHKLTSGIGMLLSANGVKVVKKHAVITGRGTILADDEEYRAKDIIICTGSVPVMPDIVGTEHAVTSDGILTMDSLPRRMAIVGGGVIGLEFAVLLSEFGVKVAIIEMMDSLISMADEAIIEAASGIMKKSGIDVYCGSKVTQITPDGLVFQQEEDEIFIEADKVLMSTGRRPNTDITMLDSLGISHKRGCIITDDHMRTNVDGIWAAGDVNGVSLLAHTASAEGTTAVKNIAGIGCSLDYNTIPSCIYTTPEIAWVGKTEKQAGSDGTEIKVSMFPMSANGKSMVEGDSSGFIKLIADKNTNEIIGAHLFCSGATDMIGEIVLGMNMECCAEEIAGSVHPHPTISESLMEAASGIFSKPVHIFTK